MQIIQAFTPLIQSLTTKFSSLCLSDFPLPLSVVQFILCLIKAPRRDTLPTSIIDTLFSVYLFIHSKASFPSELSISSSQSAEMELKNAKPTKLVQTVPPKRGQIKIKIIKTIFKSVTELSCSCGPSGRRGEEDGAEAPLSSTSTSTTPPIPSGYNSDS